MSNNVDSLTMAGHYTHTAVIIRITIIYWTQQNPLTGNHSDLFSIRQSIKLHNLYTDKRRNGWYKRDLIQNKATSGPRLIITIPSIQMLNFTTPSKILHLLMRHTWGTVGRVGWNGSPSWVLMKPEKPLINWGSEMFKLLGTYSGCQICHMEFTNKPQLVIIAYTKMSCLNTHTLVLAPSKSSSS